MRKIFKKYMALLLAIALTFTVVPAASPVYAEEVIETQTPTESEIPTESTLPSESEAPTESPVPILCGDVDSSGSVDATDALMVLKHVVKIQLIPEHLTETADVTTNGKIEAVDALMILKYVVKLIPELPWAEDIVVVTPKPTLPPTPVPTPEPTLDPIMQPSPPADYLNRLANYVQSNGQNDGDGYRYINEVYEFTPSPDEIQQIVTEVVYYEDTGDVTFGFLNIYYNSSSNIYTVDMLELYTDGTDSETIYIRGLLNEDGEIVPSYVLGTTFANASVVKNSQFTYETYYPEGGDASAQNWEPQANFSHNQALAYIDKYLNSKFYFGLTQLGFTKY